MASPQTEDGYTKIANEIMDALCKIRIPGEARQILDVVLRKTYGWHKKIDRVSLTQFAESTGLSKVHVSQAIDKLINLNLIITEKGKGGVTEKGKAISYNYEFNKDFDTWRPLPKKVTLPKKVKGITEKGNKPLPKKGTTKEKKETIQKKRSVDFILPEDVDPDTWKDFEEMRNKLKAPMTDRAKKEIIVKLTSIGQDKNKILAQSIMNGWKGVFELKNNNNGTHTSKERLYEDKPWMKILDEDTER